MTGIRISELKSLEGRQVCLALADGGRLDNCQLVSTGRGRAETLWVFTNGTDTFVPHADVVALWETPSGPSWAGADDRRTRYSSHRAGDFPASRNA